MTLLLDRLGLNYSITLISIFWAQTKQVNLVVLIRLFLFAVFIVLGTASLSHFCFLNESSITNKIIESIYNLTIDYTRRFILPLFGLTSLSLQRFEF